VRFLEGYDELVMEIPDNTLSNRGTWEYVCRHVTRFGPITWHVTTLKCSKPEFDVTLNTQCCLRTYHDNPK